jgi:23S rRNA (uracil-5-)-methyltransferase RumA
MQSPCPNKDVCGSCGWSHIPYNKQLEQKVSDINGTFAIKKLDLKISEILPSPRTEHYRNRMDFVIDFEGRMGLRMKGKWWRVIDNHTCFISDEKIEQAFKHIRDWTKRSELSFFDRKAHTGLLRYAVIRTTSTGELMITIVTSAPTLPEAEIEAKLKDLAEIAQPTTLIWSINNTITDVSFGDDLRVVTGPGYLSEEINGHQYRISPNAFFQTNSAGAGVLLDTVEEFAGDLTDKTLLDLYCGTGFFSIAMADKAAKTIGVEMNVSAIEDAKVNAELNGVEVDYTAAPTENFDWGQYNADVVILDPPRAGMHDRALADVLRILPKTIIYISCKYKNFAREMVQLQEHYDVTLIRAIDMFPHTPHVELVARLDKKA